MLVEKGLASSTALAQALIMSGVVSVNGEIRHKSGEVISEDSTIEILKPAKYVSRGGEKLEGALEDFNILVENRICLDVGASTGGFSDCLLQKGAAKVFAIDVGTAQIDFSLRKNQKIVSIEQTHILDITPSQLLPVPDLAVIDVSFISLKKILGHIFNLVAVNADVIPMVKPQFEVEPKYLRKGVVESIDVRIKTVEEIIEFSKSLGFQYLKQTPAKIKGPKGNQEFFLHLRKI